MARASRSRQTNNAALQPRVAPIDRRSRLLVAGTEIFAERPYEDVLVQEIAERAGVAHGLLFHYFGSKRTFYFTVLDRYASAVLELFEANTIPEPARWLRKELDIFLTGVSADPQIFAGLIHGRLGAEAEVQKILNRHRVAGTERIIAKLAPERRSILLAMAVGAWLTSANEFAVEWLERGRPVAAKTVRVILTGTLTATLRGVAAADSTSKFDPDCFADA